MDTPPNRPAPKLLQERLSLELDEARREVAKLRAAREDLLANMSHELRTPMMAILGFVGLLDDENLSADDRQMYVRTIYLNAQHLLSLLNDALDYSKIEAGVLTIDSVPSNPIAVFSDVTMLMGPKARRKGLTFEASLATPMPERVNIDPTRFRQILLNLVGNAVKFTQNGGVSVIGSFLPADERHAARVRFEIHDTGVGITPPLQMKLRCLCDLGDPSRARRHSGAGLGLAVSSRLAVMLGGELSFTSEPGKGSCFVVELAAHDPEGEFIRPEIPTEPRREPPQRRVTPGHLGAYVLVVEDSIDNQRLIALHLRRAGCQVEIASNGVAALEKYGAVQAAGRRFDFILMDMQMPEMDGYETTRRMRAAGASEPILAFTAHNLASDRQHCLEAGCDDYASKPMDAAALIEYCRRWMGKRSAYKHAA